MAAGNKYAIAGNTLRNFIIVNGISDKKDIVFIYFVIIKPLFRKTWFAHRQIVIYTQYSIKIILDFKFLHLI